MTYFSFVAIYNINSFSINRTVYSYIVKGYIGKSIFSSYNNSLNKTNFFSLFNYEKSYIVFESEFQKYSSFNFKGLFENIKSKNLSFLCKMSKKKYTSFPFEGAYTDTKQGYVKFNGLFKKNKLLDFFKRVVFSQEKVKSIKFVSKLGMQVNGLNVESLKESSFFFRGTYLTKKYVVYSLNPYYFDVAISFKSNNSYQTSLVFYLSKESFELNINKFYNLFPVLNIVEFKIEHKLSLFPVYSPTQKLVTAYLLDKTNSIYLKFIGHIDNKPLENFYSHQIIFKLNIHNTYTNYDMEDVVSFDVDFKNIKIVNNPMNFVFVDVYTVSDFKNKNIFMLKQKQPLYFMYYTYYNNIFFSGSKKITIIPSNAKLIKTVNVVSENKIELFSRKINMFKFINKTEGVSGRYYIDFYNEYVLGIKNKEKEYQTTKKIVEDMFFLTGGVYEDVINIRTGHVYKIKDYNIIFSSNNNSLNTIFTYDILNFHRYFFSGSNIINATTGSISQKTFMDLNDYILEKNYFSILTQVNSYNSDYIINYNYKEHSEELGSIVFRLCKLETEINLNSVYSVLTGYNNITKIDLTKVTLGMRLNINLHNIPIYYSSEQEIKVRNG